jgi:hypothetical protein
VISRRGIVFIAADSDIDGIGVEFSGCRFDACRRVTNRWIGLVDGFLWSVVGKHSSAIGTGPSGFVRSDMGVWLMALGDVGDRVGRGR